MRNAKKSQRAIFHSADFEIFRLSRCENLAMKLQAPILSLLLTQGRVRFSKNAECIQTGSFFVRCHKIIIDLLLLTLTVDFLSIMSVNNLGCFSRDLFFAVRLFFFQFQLGTVQRKFILVIRLENFEGNNFIWYISKTCICRSKNSQLRSIDRP